MALRLPSDPSNVPVARWWHVLPVPAPPLNDESCGSHAMSPAAAITGSAAADVIVDLSELTFADASLMVDIAMLARRLRLKGFGVQLRGASPHIGAQHCDR